MIIYGESLPADSKIPALAQGLLLDKAFPDIARLLLDHARQGLSSKSTNRSAVLVAYTFPCSVV